MSCSVTKCLNFEPVTKKDFGQSANEDVFNSIDYNTIGGILSDKSLAWTAHGPRLEVKKNGNIVGSWTFGYIVKDLETRVTFVKEIQRLKRTSLLAIALETSCGGLLCIFDIYSSRVLRAIQVKEKITSLHVIHVGFSLPGPLRNFDGIIAIGVVGGPVFLIDICQQICEEALSLRGLLHVQDELNPSELNIITPRDIDKIELHKELAIKNNEHLAIYLNCVFDKATEHFAFKGPKGDDRLYVNKEEVAISALYYCPQMGSLLVGFNFGALQLFNLINFDLMYTSPVCDDHIPITHFTFQEPADDPRAFCYIWALYSANEEYESCLPLAVMYAFCFNSKEYHEGYGYLYEDFNTAAIYFQMELGLLDNGLRFKSKIRRGYSLALQSNQENYSKKINYSGGQSNDNNKEDGLILCFMSWCIEFSNGTHESFICVFDLNQWYKEQMPKVPNGLAYGNYMIQMSLSDQLKEIPDVSNILDVYFDTNFLQQFHAPQKLEEYFYPNSISFDFITLHESCIVTLNKSGIQQYVLNQLKSANSLALIEPAKYHQEIVSVGLLPLFTDLVPNTPITTSQQREIIFNTLLENDYCYLLCGCAKEWANGSCLSAGCSLDVLINWAYERGIILKNKAYGLCVTLFNYSGVKLDNNATVLLNSTMKQLNTINRLFEYISENVLNFVSNMESFREQFASIKKIRIYYEVLRWLYGAGVLPECSIEVPLRPDEVEREQVPYLLTVLMEFYTKQRELFLKIANNDNCILFIDKMIELECGGDKLKTQWEQDGGNNEYPPPSIQALLRSYLINDIDDSNIHLLMMYFCMDLVVTLQDDKYQSARIYLNHFADSFGISKSLYKIIQAFWHLDHGDSKNAVETIIDPMVKKNDLKDWHHKTMIRSLMLQNQNNYALYYVQVMKPPIQDEQDIINTITLYVSNNMLDEAWKFKNRYMNSNNAEVILLHLFEECKSNCRLKSIMYKNLSQQEEAVFLNYLTKNSANPAYADLLVSYHILRSEYLEAFKCNDKLLINNKKREGLLGIEKAPMHERMVNLVKQSLPPVCLNIINACKDNSQFITKSLKRPTPMSTFFTNTKERNAFKSDMLIAAISKARSTYKNLEDDELRTKNTPFLCAHKMELVKPRVPHVVKDLNYVKSFKKQEHEEPSPCKKLKLSTCQSTSLAFNSIASSILETPLVLRKKLSTINSSFQNTNTPHSILKTRNDESKTTCAKNLSYNLQSVATPTRKQSTLGLSPRKSLIKTPAVHFEGLTSSSSSANNISSFINSTSLSENTNKNLSSKNTSNDEDEFYSPENSLDTHEEVSDLSKSLERTIENKSYEFNGSSLSFSPKPRRPLKRSYREASPIRSSVRLSNKKNVDTSSSDSTAQSSILKLTPRKSLIRNVSNDLVKKHVEEASKVVKSFSTSKYESTFEGDHMSSNTISFVSKTSVIEKSRTFSDSLSTSEPTETRTNINETTFSNKTTNLHSVQFDETMTDPILIETETDIDDGKSIVMSKTEIKQNKTENDENELTKNVWMEIDEPEVETANKHSCIVVYEDLSNSSMIPNVACDGKSDIVEFDNDLLNYGFATESDPLESSTFVEKSTIYETETSNTFLKENERSSEEIIEILSSSDDGKSSNNSSSNKSLESEIEENILVTTYEEDTYKLDVSDLSNLESSDEEHQQSHDSDEATESSVDEESDKEKSLPQPSEHIEHIVKLTKSMQEDEEEENIQDSKDKQTIEEEPEVEYTGDKKRFEDDELIHSTEEGLQNLEQSTAENIYSLTEDVPIMSTSEDESKIIVEKKKIDHAETSVRNIYETFCNDNSTSKSSSISSHEDHKVNETQIDPLGLFGSNIGFMGEETEIAQDKTPVRNIYETFREDSRNSNSSNDKEKVTEIGDTKLNSVFLFESNITTDETKDNHSTDEETQKFSKQDSTINIFEDIEGNNTIDETKDNHSMDEETQNFSKQDSTINIFEDIEENNTIDETKDNHSMDEETLNFSKQDTSITNFEDIEGSKTIDETKNNHSMDEESQNILKEDKSIKIFEDTEGNNIKNKISTEIKNNENEQNTESPKHEKDSIEDKELIEIEKDVTIKKSTRKRTISESKESEIKNEEKPTNRKISKQIRTRSHTKGTDPTTSVPPATRSTRSTRSNSTDSESAASKLSVPKTNLRSKRAASVQPHLTLIEEELTNPDETDVIPAEKVRRARSETIDASASSRPLTRHQLALRQKTKIAEVDKLHPIDPICLLERVEFEGEVDPDEKKIYEDDALSIPPSPTPSLSVSGVKRSRRLRSGSYISEEEVGSSVTTPVKMTKKRGTRKASTDSIVSATGGKKVGEKKSRKKKEVEEEIDETEEEPVRRSTRTRSRAGSVASSVVSEMSDTGAKKKTTKRK